VPGPAPSPGRLVVQVVREAACLLFCSLAGPEMQALVLLLWTGALLGFGRCQNAGQEAVSRSWVWWGPGAGGTLAIPTPPRQAARGEWTAPRLQARL
jgi:hypothetical protein